VALAELSDDEIDTILAQTGMSRSTSATKSDPTELKRDLKAVKQKGYSLNWGENTRGVGSIAAPVRGSDGQLLAVLSIAFPTSLMRKGEIGVLGELVAKKAAAIEQAMWPADSRGAA
jgi:DNA-binding IclR family transcriptional regulator